MQSKASMVMPCYNKVDYIAGMFDSIIAQKWDNIELILVNDGSTDGTREVIATYEPKFRERGYEVVIVDQENAGVCAAAKAGLARVTGDYVCCVDADDELYPNYVSVMATALDDDSTIDYVGCMHSSIFANGESLLFLFPTCTHWHGEQLLRYCLVNASNCMPWLYMIRRSYFSKCHIVDNYYTSSRGSHEPGFVIPLHAYGGKFKTLNEFPLYKYYNQRENAHAAMTDVQKIFSHWSEYARLGKITVLSLPDEIADKDTKRRYFKYLTLMEKFLYYHRLSGEFPALTKIVDVAQIDYWNELNGNNLVQCDADCGHENSIAESIELSRRMLSAKIVFLGAKGKAAQSTIPLLKNYFKNSYYCEYWDEKAELGDCFKDGTPIYKPDYDSLNNLDFVFVLPKNIEVVESIREKLGQFGGFRIYNV
jgi:glycosyltransferase involved in cell wall biosynthesis